MVIDFHVHGKITKTAAFNEENLLQCINEGKSEGIEGFALTEHCHANNFFEAYNFLETNYKYVNNYYDVNGFKVFIGAEITTREINSNQKIDILIIGERSYILELRNKVMNNSSEQEFIELEKLFSLCNTNEVLVILAHPYRRSNEFPNLSLMVLDRIDALELNATDLHKHGIDEMKNKVIELSKKLNKKIIGGSDSHHFIQFGSIKNKFNQDCQNIKELKAQIRIDDYNVEISPNLSIRVKSQKIIKKLICNS